ncbi:MAG: efflux RND transporter permease subunit [Acidobacteria bacterium]|nr:efflux RND transporter permease subunit [Acidobacteriota bacterium]
MKIIESAIRYPVTTAVGVILLVLFGTIALFRIPIQLTPNVDEPQITVRTFWPGASPYEIEREITQEQEEQLKGVEGLTKLESQSFENFGQVILTFQVGTDLDTALLKVSNRLEQVRRYPEDADKPVVSSVNLESSAIAWMVIQPIPGGGFQGDIATLYEDADNEIKPRLERVPGVGMVNIYCGREREMQVIVDPAALAARQVTLREMGDALDRENRDFSGGDFDEGKRRYLVRTVGEYSSPEEISNVIIAYRNGVPIYVRDVARVELGYRKSDAVCWQRDSRVLVMNALRETGSNVLKVMEGLRRSVEEVNHDLLRPRGLELSIVFDETEYIYSSIGLVRQSLLLGGTLAVLILLLFLRSVTSTLVIAVAIPVSLIGTFMVMVWFDRTLNVISLAGMAFASGMVVDNSIVVLENIYRHRQMGKPRFQAAFDGAREVWGAVLASTLTTVAVFVPVVFIQEEAGQLFRDIAIAISCSVGLSLIVSITVVPSLSNKILRAVKDESHYGAHGFHNLFGFAPVIRRLAERVPNTVYWICGTTPRRLATIAVLTLTPILLAYLLMPKAEYLPTGNTNLVFAILLPPPGYNHAEVARMRDTMEPVLAPIWRPEPRTPEALAQPGGGVNTFWYVGWGRQVFMGARSNDPDRVRELIPVVQQAIRGIPGTFGIVNQASLFQRGAGGGRLIDIEITGPELEQLIGLGGQIFGQVMQKIPGAQAQPIPSLDLGNPEVRVVTHRRRAADVAISNRELGFAVNALVDGAKVSDYQYEGREIDLMLRGQDEYATRTHVLEMIPIAAPDGRLVTLGSVADVEVLTGPVQINHVERDRAITIRVIPPEQMPLEAAMDTIEGEILQPLRDRGELGGLYHTAMSGTADKLAQTGRALRWNFVLVIVISYLLMAALFESFLYPFVILFSVPLAALGGFLGLGAVNAFLSYQALDVLTMLGFVILVGIVVNNAILIVHQSLNHIRDEGLEPREAIREAVRNRLRPIFMTVSTTVFGMLPLVLFPGAGSELYRGLGSVVLGGLIVSTVFTLFLVPAMFSLGMSVRAALAARVGALTPGEADD